MITTPLKGWGYYGKWMLTYHPTPVVRLMGGGGKGRLKRGGIGGLGVVVWWEEVPTTAREFMDEGVSMSNLPASALRARNTNPTGFYK